MWSSRGGLSRLWTVGEPLVTPPLGAIALDSSLAGAQTTGIGLYVSQLARALALGPLRERLWLLGGQRRALPAGVAHTEARTRSRSLWMVGEVPGLLASRDAALFHGVQNFALPLRRPGRTRFVLTVHDLIPLTRPETVSRPFRLQFAAWLARSLSLADAVLCDSEWTRGELRRLFPRAPQSRVVHLGVDHVPSRKMALAALPPAGIGGGPLCGPTGRGRRAEAFGEKPYLLHVGALDARKNVGLLLEAFEALPRARDLSLVLVGQPSFGAAPLLATIERLRGIGLDVRWLGHVPRRQLWGLMARAALLCSPSGAEGFGLPPLEGLSLGVPVVASRIPPHVEILGDAALFASPGDVGELRDALATVLDGGQLERTLRERGPARAARFRWSRCADETAQLYREVTGDWSGDPR